MSHFERAAAARIRTLSHTIKTRARESPMSTEWAVYLRVRNAPADLIPCADAITAERLANLYAGEMPQRRVWIVFRGEKWMRAGAVSVSKPGPGPSRLRVLVAAA